MSVTNQLVIIVLGNQPRAGCRVAHQEHSSMLRLDTGGGCLAVLVLGALLFLGGTWLLFCSFGRCV